MIDPGTDVAIVMMSEVLRPEFEEPDGEDVSDGEDVGLVLGDAVFITPVVGLEPYVNTLLEVGEPSTAPLPNNNWEQNESQTEVAVAPAAES